MSHYFDRPVALSKASDAGARRCWLKTLAFHACGGAADERRGSTLTQYPTVTEGLLQGTVLAEMSSVIYQGREFGWMADSCPYVYTTSHMCWRAIERHREAQRGGCGAPS